KRRIGRERGRLLSSRDALVANALSGAPVIEMKANILRLRRRIEPYRDVHEPEADAAGPDRLSHVHSCSHLRSTKSQPAGFPAGWRSVRSVRQVTRAERV